MYKHLLPFFILSIFQTFGQNQHMNWNFGFNAGINFSAGNPVNFTGSQMETSESCASISDANGNLLFYTNALNVWDQNNNIMPNGSGLFGNESALCMIIPKPQTPGVYYVVATDAGFSTTPHGLTYSEVNMSLNGGNGDVTAVKNIQLNALNGEWITAVPHANCIDTWIITHGYTTNSVFMAFHVSAAGVDPVPVITDIGFDIPDSNHIVGIMRPNPAGTKIAMTRPAFDGLIDLIDFDKATGVATGVTNIYTATGFNWGYGLEFSRSGNVLYSGEVGNGKVFQYDMTAPDIGATRIQVGAMTVPGEVGQLQIAPNDKIYVGYNVFSGASNHIGVINNPEILGTACNFVENGFSIGSASHVYGLPWYYNPDAGGSSAPNLGPDMTLCAGASVNLSTGASNSAGANITWSDGSTDTVLQVTESGTYWIQYQSGSCAALTDTVTIIIDTAQIGHLTPDKTGCAALSVQLEGTGSPGVSGWAWDMGNGTNVLTQNAGFLYTTPGNYAISLSAISANNCPLHDPDSIHVEVYPVPVAQFTTNPTQVHPGEPILCIDQSIGTITSWLWKMNDEQISDDSEFSFTPADLQVLNISLTVISQDGCSDTIEKTIGFAPQDLLYIPNTFTPNGDGDNDLFYPVDYFGLVQGFSVYNRWGELVWSGKTAADAWDGNAAGKQAMPGVYTWTVTTAPGGILSKEMQGHVTLVR